MKLRFRVTGMTCSKCVDRVTGTARKFPEVRKLEMEESSGVMTIDVADGSDTTRLIGAIEQCGKPLHDYRVFNITDC